MTIKLIAGAFGLALIASPALSAEALPFGAPSEPTVWGHEVHVKKPSVEIEPVELRRTTEPQARAGFTPSEPTIWGHKPEGGR